MKITNYEMDMLREIINIGAGNATTSLSNMTNHQVLIDVPTIRRVPVNEISSILPKQVMVLLHTTFHGGLDLEVIHSISDSIACFLVDKLSGQIINPEELIKDISTSVETIDSIAKSSLLEMCNIINGSFANAISSFINEPIMTSTPSITYDYPESALDSIIATACSDADDLFVFKTQISSDSRSVEIGMYMIPTHQSEIKLIEKIKEGAS